MVSFEWEGRGRCSVGSHLSDEGDKGGTLRLDQSGSEGVEAAEEGSVVDNLKRRGERVGKLHLARELSRIEEAVGDLERGGLACEVGPDRDRERSRRGQRRGGEYGERNKGRDSTASWHIRRRSGSL